MSYDDVEIEDMEWNEEIQAYTYPCPCGDLFQITKEDLRLGEEIANCPSCSLYITVIYNMEDFQNDTKKNNESKSRQAVAVANKIETNNYKIIINIIGRPLACSFGHETISKNGEINKILRKITTTIMIMMMVNNLAGALENKVRYSPCSDTQISKRDGFTVGVAISSREAFFLDQVQLPPCHSRLGLAVKMAPLALFRPNVDEISLLSIDTISLWLYGVISMRLKEVKKIHGSKYAIRSYPVKVADGSNTITDLTLLIATSKFMWRFQGQTSTSSHLTLGTTLTIRGSTRLPPSMQML
nr:unnamed protein product [Brassica oleracea]